MRTQVSWPSKVWATTQRPDDSKAAGSSVTSTGRVITRSPNAAHPSIASGAQSQARGGLEHAHRGEPDGALVGRVAGRVNLGDVESSHPSVAAGEKGRV